jgi:isopentenyl-diphosphate delta-isomerase
MPESTISRRKSEHLRIVLEQDVEHTGSNLLEGVQLMNQALPELDLEQIDTTCEFFGRRLQAPLMITSMTGGADATKEMNHELAAAAERAGIAFSVGSQRILLRYPEHLPDFAVRQRIPNGVLLGNIGAVQLLEHPIPVIAELVDRIEADGICVHLNPAQELCQPEGNRRFAGIVDQIARLVERLDGRVLVKETGAGISPRALLQLDAAGVRYIDVAGSGGTSWTRVEMHRVEEGPERQLGETLSDWGIPTAVCVIAARSICSKETCIVGSGGVVRAIDCARVIAAGAQIAGFARSILQRWREGGEEGAAAFIDRLQRELRTIMLLTGSRDISALRHAKRVYTGELRQWLQGTGFLEQE